MTLAQLRTFEAVARLGGVTRAAIELHLAQPTVSTQLRELAAGVGQVLVVPAGRGIRLTDAGARLRQAAADIFARWQVLEDELHERAGVVRGRLRVAGVTTSEYFVAQLLQAFVARYPDVSIDLAVENRASVAARLERGDDDCAITMLPPNDNRLATVPFLANPLVAIAAIGDQAFGRGRRVSKPAPMRRRRVPLERFVAAPLLMREPGSGTRQATEAHFAKYGVSPVARMTLGSNEAIKHAVAAGLGVAIVSRHALAADAAQDGLLIVPVANLPIRRHWHLVWRKDRVLSLASRAFISYVRDGVDAGFPFEPPNA